MKLAKKIFLLIFFLFLTGCATVDPPYIPASLEIIPPASDVPSELAVFSGIWEGKWGGMADAESIIAIEKIDAKKAEIYFSCSGNPPGNVYITGTILPEYVIEWKMDKMPQIGDEKIECPCTLTLRMGKDLNTAIAFWEFHVYNFKMRADLKRKK